ncbi:MAG TPA: glycosyltransferase [Mycobacteriales bacterium]|jgi:glycosyltransferase involved in cell wall biosynthesis|nr:glycosyltransferase [Mycobacteriales bacterium]
MPLTLVAYSDARGRGGAEHSLGHLLAHLPDDVRVHVVGPDPVVTGWLGSRRPGARTHVVAGLGPTARLLHRLRPDVVHLNRCTPWACQAGTAAALTLPGARVTTVDQLPLRSVDLPTVLRTRALTRRVDAAVAVGEASARRVEDFYALGRGSVRSIPNYVPDPGPPRRRRRSGPLRLVSVGRLDRVKGHDVLLRALADVPHAELVLLGEGGTRVALEKQVAELGLADRVRMPGWQEDVPRLLPRYDALVLPSRTEGWPLTVVEAMLAGLPVVATPVGSVAEAVADGDSGLLVPSDDPAALAAALRRLTDEPGLAERLGARGRQVAAAGMTAPRMAERWLALWDELQAGPRTARLVPPAPRP